MPADGCLASGLRVRLSRAKEEAQAQSGFGASRFESPPPRPDQALLGWRRGQVKNKSNDPAALIHPKDRVLPVRVRESAGV